MMCAEHLMPRTYWRRAYWYGFGPFARQGRFFGPGEVRLALLRRAYRRRAYWYGFGPFARQGRFLGAREVRLGLMSMLGEQPMHGYELMRRLEERSGGIYRASAGTVYPTLQQLEDESLVASETQDGKKIYRLTDAGRRELERNDEAVRAIWRRAQRWQDWRGFFEPDAA